jgi:hypothetical protein
VPETKLENNKEPLPEAATSVIKKEPSKAIAKDMVSEKAFSDLPVNDVYQASGNEKSLRNMRSLN